MNIYDKVAEWILQDCGDPDEEIVFLLKNSFDTEDKLTEHYGDGICHDNWD